MTENSMKPEKWLKEMLGENTSVDEIDQKLIEALARSAEQELDSSQPDDLTLARMHKSFVRNTRDSFRYKNTKYKFMALAASIALAAIISFPVIRNEFPTQPVDTVTTKSGGSFSIEQLSSDEYRAFSLQDNTKVTMRNLEITLEDLAIPYERASSDSQISIKFNISENRLEVFNRQSSKFGLHLDQPGKWWVVLEEN